ncbi:MAG: DUF951 domain-containing protein [Capsulimonadales bacterium]|nr:DUF951 domain-containing protein [Capsulimonadales bacterium]
MPEESTPGEERPLTVGDVAILRKAHPCGGRDWKILRVGADIGLECRVCGRKILIPRAEFERRCVTVRPETP